MIKAKQENQGIVDVGDIEINLNNSAPRKGSWGAPLQNRPSKMEQRYQINEEDSRESNIPAPDSYVESEESITNQEPEEQKEPPQK